MPFGRRPNGIFHFQARLSRVSRLLLAYKLATARHFPSPTRHAIPQMTLSASVFTHGTLNA
ncbi:hypothetical protein J2803_004221 [Paraburkholderia phenoliruptrix]|nr:hypothetical protein [Paraburkholderia phenoliruptrix]